MSDSITYIIAGLGNPGDEYAHTRHNAGFDAVDAIASCKGVTYWKEELGAKTAKIKLTFPINNGEGECKVQNVDVVLVKPQSFMNTSGGPISKLMRAYDVDPAHLIVIHDDLDLEPGRIRVKSGGRDAGHNGLKSIIAKCSSKDFLHVKTGIGRPPGRMPVVEWVLGLPKREAREIFDETCVRAGDAALHLIQYGLVKTQDAFN